MIRQNDRRSLILGLLITALSASAAHAGAVTDLTRGLGLFDVRIIGQRNPFGDGMTVSAIGNYGNRRFDFGVGDLTLNGGFAATLDFTTRGIPKADFTLTTGGAPLSYVFKTTNGLQDLNVSGNMLMDVRTHMTALGFYEETFQISNRGTITTHTGGELTGTKTLDFDAGPISVSGNIFTDALAALTQPFFNASGTENPFAQFSAQAVKQAALQKSSDELRARIDKGEVLSDDDIATLVNNSVLAAMMGKQPSDHLFDGLLVPDGLLQTNNASAVPTLGINLVPEPCMIGLLGIALLAWRRRRPTI